MDRRTFLFTAATTAAVSAVSKGVGAQTQAPASASTGKFKLRYAPDFGAFKAHAGDDPIETIKFAADQGFMAMFDNGLNGRPKDQQERIGQEMARLGMTLGPFVMYAEWKKPWLVTRDNEVRPALVKMTQDAVEVAKRANVKWALLVPGPYSQNLEWDYQTANVIENLKASAEVAEPAGLVVVIEPLNPHNHPGLFLQKIPQAYQICKAVGSSSIKIINDLYHQQITEGNLIPNIDRAWDQIAAFHVGDNPGRKEPGTGEINYKTVFRHIRSKGYTGVLCMEHGNSKGSGKEAEKSLIAAYRAADDF
jgi:hydroxypyruvate isomerase